MIPTPEEIAREMREIEAEQRRQQRNGHYREPRVNKEVESKARIAVVLPFCALCCQELVFEERSGGMPRGNLLVRRRLYRHIDKHLRGRIGLVKNSINVCIDCNRALDTLVNERRNRVTIEKTHRIDKLPPGTVLKDLRDL